MIDLVHTDRAIWISRHVLPHERALRGWLAKYSASAINIDDIVQESYAAIFDLATVDHIRRPQAYLFEIARSIILQQLRRARIVPIHSVADVALLDRPDDQPSPEDIVAGRQELRQLADAVAQLPPRCAEVFRLRKIDGLSQRDTASALGISENTVEKQIGKAIRVLSDILGRGGKQRLDASKARKGNRKDNEGTPRDQFGD
ncbi:RNA polymerase sigma factor [Sphingopyxis sp. C-1]|uniref:RNA polymerase sigma factor n=1 Tax=Sphingopyxis sp. C-1 TaxID=262667 RepID=UPI000784B717|nr:sigma-70 family RNA polymerase sigma factor [Sphingopyxis sp. C-1]